MFEPRHIFKPRLKFSKFGLSPLKKNGLNDKHVLFSLSLVRATHCPPQHYVPGHRGEMPVM